MEKEKGGVLKVSQSIPSVLGFRQVFGLPRNGQRYGKANGFSGAGHRSSQFNFIQLIVT